GWSHTRGSDLRCRGNTWFIPYETIQSRARERPHPATFPVQLAEWCIKLHGLSCVHTMLDPFLGIGNSAIAAQRCGVKKFIGFEIDETYLAEAKRRVSKILQPLRCAKRDPDAIHAPVAPPTGRRLQKSPIFRRFDRRKFLERLDQIPRQRPNTIEDARR